MSAPAALAAAKLLLPETKMKHEDLEAQAPTGCFIKKKWQKNLFNCTNQGTSPISAKNKTNTVQSQFSDNLGFIVLFQKSNFKFTT